MRTTVALLLITLLAFATGCASNRPKASEEDRLYYLHGGQTLSRKRTETRNEEVNTRVWNSKTSKYDTVTTYEKNTVTVLEIETPNGVIDYDVSPSVANKLSEGKPIPTINDQQAAAAGLVGDCCEITRVVQGGTAAGAGVQEGDLLISYNGESTLGVKRAQELIKASSPSDTVWIIIERDDKQIQYQIGGGPLGVELEDYWR